MRLGLSYPLDLSLSVEQTAARLASTRSLSLRPAPAVEDRSLCSSLARAKQPSQNRTGSSRLFFSLFLLFTIIKVNIDKTFANFVDTSIVDVILEVDLDLVACGRGQGGDQHQEAGVEQGHAADL